MQLKIYQRLNQLLIAMMVILVILVIYGILRFNEFPGNWRYVFIGGVVVIALLFFFGFKTLELNWDKYLIQRMILKNQIALAELTKAELLYPIKDSSGRYYTLYQVEASLKDQEMNAKKVTFYEKFNAEVKMVPTGNVYVTYDPQKPERLFIIPNGMIARFINLAPTVNRYEQSGIKIRYLDVVDEHGLIIRTYKESFALNQDK